MNPKLKPFDEVKEQILDTIYLIATILVFPVVFTSVIRFLKTGWLAIYTWHIAEIFVVIIIYLFRKHLPFTQKIYAFILIINIPVVLGFFSFGLMANAKLYILLSVILLVLLIGRKSVYIYLGLISIFLIACAWLFHQGILKYQVQFETYKISYIPWINLIATFVFLALVISLIIDRILTVHARSNETLKESENKYRMLFNAGKDALFVHKVLDDGRFGDFIEVNDEACSRLGYTREELLSLKTYDTVSPLSHTNSMHVYETLIRDKSVVFEQLQRSKNGKDIPVEMNARLFEFNNERIVLTVARDISERKKNELLSQARLNILQQPTSSTLKELLSCILNEIEHITGSTIGFYHFLEHDQETLVLQAWSSRTRDRLCTASGEDLHYNINLAGIWADCVRQRKTIIHNDYATVPGKKGLPEGHAPVIREIVAPILRNNLIVAIVGVGNKLSDYNETDVELINQVADLSWDIVESKIKEIKLAESNEQFHMIIEQAADAVFLFSEEGRIINFNQQACHELGYSREELLTLAVSDIDCSFPEADSWQQFWLKLKPDDAIKIESMLIHRDQSQIPFEININLFDFRGKKAALGFARNVKERKKVEKELESYRNQLEDLVLQRTSELSKSETTRMLALDAGNIGVWSCLISLAGKSPEILEESIYSDYKTREIFDIKNDTHLASFNWTSIVLKQDQKRIWHQMIMAVKKSGKFSHEIRILDSEKKVRFILLQGKVTGAEDKNVFRIDGIAVDNTTERLAGQKLLHMLEREKELNRLKGNFVAMASHQFRTPLTTIRSNSELIQMYSSEANAQIKNLLFESASRIDSEVIKLNDLISDVMLLGRAGAGKIPFSPEPTDLVQLCQRIIAETKFQNQGERMVILEIIGNVRYVVLDVKLVIQIIRNLLSNAFKFSHENTGLTLRFRRKSVDIVVKDSGIGIPETMHKNMFQEFFRAENARGIAGSGLGLVIVKEFVLIHSGRIRFTSKENQGSEFAVTLPYNLPIVAET